MKRHYYFKEGFLGIIGILIFFAVTAYGAEESITLTTYYPSPYGVYSEMRLYPKNNPTTCDGTQRGLMYYDATDNKLKICNGTPPYQDIGGGYWAASPSNSANIYNTNLGNVGIGTNNPAAKFQITSPTAAIGSFYFGAALGPAGPGGSSSDISFDGGTGSQFYFNNFGPDSTGETGFLYRNNPILIMKNSGNVGIGTMDTLQLKLYLNANSPTPAGRNGMQISTPLGHYVSLGGGIGTDGSNTAGLHIGNQAGNNIGGEGGTLYYDYDAPDHTLVAASTGGIRIAALGQLPPAGRNIIFSTNPANIERMRITDAGSVGIGTTNPGARLHVAGTMGCQFPGVGPWGGDLFLVSQEGNRPVARIRDDNGAENPVLQFAKGTSWMNLEYYGSYLGIYGNMSNTVRISNIAVGGAFPGYFASWPYETIGMHPTNNLRINFGSTEKYVFNNNGWAVAAAGGGWTTSSDQQFKENVVELTDVMRALKNIRGVRFSWKTKDFPQKGFPEGTQVGFIAQEIEQEFPELVATDSQGYKSLDYGKLTPVLLEAIKEQQTEIESLEARLEALEKR